MMTLRKGWVVSCFAMAVVIACVPVAGAQSWMVIPSNGPFAGGNTVLVTNVSPAIGDGGDITNVTVGGVAAAFTTQGVNWVSFVSPTTGVAGVKDIVIQSASAGGTTLSNAYTYNPAGQIGGTVDWSQWQESAGMPAARANLAAGVISNALYAVGGVDSGNGTETNVYRYAGTNWTEVAGLPAPRRLLAAGVLSNALYTVGGEFSAVWANVYRYATNWTEVASLPAPRERLAVGVLSNALYAIGGLYGYGNVQSNVYRYVTNWTEVASLPAPRYDLAAGVLNGALYVIGGATGAYAAQSNVFRYVTNWTEVASLPAGRYALTAEVLNGALYAMGGYNSSGVPMANVYRYDGTNWTEVAALPAARADLAAGVLNGVLYTVGGNGYNQYYQVYPQPNVYRYPRLVPGVIPSGGIYTGGFQVVISGYNLGNGSDITNVTLCGLSASIVTQSVGQITVLAGASIAGLLGDVAVYSTSYGATVASNAFTYTAPVLGVLGNSGVAIANGEAASSGKGTDFGHRLVGVSLTNTLSITNTGNATLAIRGWTTNGAGASAFTVAGLPTTLAAGASQNFTVRFAPTQAMTYAVALQIANNTPGATNYTLNLRGSVFNLSTNVGPFAGGNTITITNNLLGSGSDITNVLVGGVAATIVTQGTSWVTIMLPATGEEGVKDIVIQSALVGDSTCFGGYTVNPAGLIYVGEDWRRWSEVAGMPAGRSYLAAAVLNGALYAMGGDGPSSSTNVYRYNGTNWTEVLGLPIANTYLGAGVLNDKLYAVGGNVGGDRVYRYDVTNWTAVAAMPINKMEFGVGVLNDKLYTVGMYSSSTYGTNVCRYDGTNWANVAGLPAQRRALAAEVWSNALYAIGGWDSPVKTNVYRYDGTNWTEVAGLPTARANLAAAVLNGALYSVGGNDGYTGTNVYRYNGKKWKEVAGLPAEQGQNGIAAGVLNGAIHVLGCGAKTNVYRYPAAVATSGVSPSSGSFTGGYAVVISGYNLGNGTDITNVTLCGLQVAGIASQSATQLTVMASGSSTGVVGDVAVYSTSFGMTVKTHAFTYLKPEIAVLGTNGAPIASGSVAALAAGNDFGRLFAGVSLTNTFSITNAGTATLSISGVTTSGASGFRFQVSGLPAAVSPGGVSNFTVCYAPTQPGDHDAALLIANNATNYTLNLRGSAYSISTNIGPFAGGNTLTITNLAMGNGVDITNVLVGGVSATIAGQGANWVTFTVSAAQSAGLKDIVIQSASVGATTLAGLYTANPAGRIGWVVEDWTQWQEVPGLPAPREYLAAGTLNGALYAIGGDGSSGISTNVYRYDGANWAEVAGLPTARAYLAAGVLNGALYAFGDYAATNVYRYNGTNWAEVAGLPAAREGLAAGVLNGALYAFGGWDGIAVRTNVYRYNGTNWTQVAGLPAPREYLAAGVLNGALYAVGGDNNVTAQTNVYRYDGTIWTEVAGLPAARDFLAAGTLNGALYAVGGNAGTNVYRYNGTIWTEVAGLPAARAGLAAEVLNGVLYAVGGDNAGLKTNVFRYPRIAAIVPGVSPTSGSTTGGYPVVITGTNLGNGADITNVTICGVSAAGIVSQSATQVVVTAGAGGAGLGDVVVYSTSYGATIKANAFQYDTPTTVAITAAAGPHGVVAPSGVVEVAYGGSTSFVVTADAYYHIGSLLTNGINEGAAVNRRAYTSVWVNATATGMLAAAFAENLTTNTATPEWWLAQYGWTNNFEAAETNDPDADRLLTWQEWIAGTDPTNQWSVLSVTNVFPAASGFVLEWPSVTNRVYGVDRATNLIPSGFTAIATNLPATPPANVYTDQVSDKAFYRINVTKP